MAPTATLAPVHRCDTCRGHLVSISLERPAGTMTMRSCSRCDTRWWHRDDEATDLGGVLGTLREAPRTTVRG